jgi:hypothetical protein
MTQLCDDFCDFLRFNLVLRSPYDRFFLPFDDLLGCSDP